MASFGNLDYRLIIGPIDLESGRKILNVSFFDFLQKMTSSWCRNNPPTFALLPFCILQKEAITIHATHYFAILRM
jgi:hypothetical protein